MTIYLILLLILGVAGWFYCFKPTKGCDTKNLNQLNSKNQNLSKIQIVVVIALILTLVSACRGISVGYDTVNYYAYFNFKQVYPTNVTFEPLYEQINFIVVKLGLPYSVVLFICAAITFASFGVAIYRFSNNPIMAFFFFVAIGFLGNTFNAIRQYLALSIFLFALKYIKDGGFIKYTILILFAYFFHSSALVLLPIYFIRYFKLSPKFMLCVVTALLVGTVFLEPGIKLISKIMNFDYYERYFVSGIAYQGVSTYYVLYALGLICVFLVFYTMRNKVKEKYENTKNYDLFLMLFFICVCIRAYGTFTGLFSIINRLNVYFFFSIVFLIPYLFECVKISLKKICVLATLLLGVAYNIISGVFRETNGVYPYKFIWGTQILPTICFTVAMALFVTILMQKTLTLIER